MGTASNSSGVPATPAKRSFKNVVGSTVTALRNTDDDDDDDGDEKEEAAVISYTDIALGDEVSAEHATSCTSWGS